MSDTPDIVERLRAAVTYEAQRGRPTLAALLTEAADLIERQRYNLGRLETALVMARGSLAEKTEDTTIPPFVILPAEPNTPR